MELVSVVIPIYNAERTIWRTLESVRQQTYTAIEWVLLNDGSSDRSMELVKNFVEKYGITAVMVDRENKGVSFTRNEGIQLAHGTYVAFLDADDEWLPEKLEKQMEYLENTGADMISCLKSDMACRHDIRPVSLHALIYRNYFFTSGVVIRRQVLLDIGGFDESMQYGEDYNLWLRIVQKYHAVVINQRLLIYEDAEHNPQKSSLSMNLKAMEKAELASYRMLYHNKQISFWRWGSAVSFSLLRYWRRCLRKKRGKF